MELEALKAEAGAEFDPPELKKVPRGYDESHPAANWLKHKSFFIGHRYTEDEMQSFDTFLDATANVISRFEPLRLYFSAAFEGAYDEDTDYLYE